MGAKKRSPAAAALAGGQKRANSPTFDFSSGSQARAGNLPPASLVDSIYPLTNQVSEALSEVSTSLNQKLQVVQLSLVEAGDLCAPTDAGRRKALIEGLDKDTAAYFLRRELALGSLTGIIRQLSEARDEVAEASHRVAEFALGCLKAVIESSEVVENRAPTPSSAMAEDTAPSQDQQHLAPAQQTATSMIQDELVLPSFDETAPEVAPLKPIVVTAYKVGTDDWVEVKRKKQQSVSTAPADKSMARATLEMTDEVKAALAALKAPRRRSQRSGSSLTAVYARVGHGRLRSVKESLVKVGVSLKEVRNVSFAGSDVLELVVKESGKKELAGALRRVGLSVLDNYDPAKPFAAHAPTDVRDRVRKQAILRFRRLCDPTRQSRPDVRHYFSRRLEDIV